MTTDEGQKGRTKPILTRRSLLGVAGAAILLEACGSGADTEGTSQTSTGGTTGEGGAGGKPSGQGGAGGGPPGTGGSSQTAGGQGGAGGSEPLVCTPSDKNILGPYYRANAPFRTDLTEPNMPGVRVTVAGHVLDPDCKPIPNALLDVWQADETGDYDNDGKADPPPDQFVLRGRMNAGPDGSYSFRTIHPGHYLNGAQYRPAHIHIIVSAPGFKSLTTQLYFEDDPYNGIDPFIVDTLIMDIETENGEEKATFDFVLPPV